MIVNFINIKELKRKSTTLYSLEFQTKYLSDLANIETLMESSHYSNLEMKLLNKKNSSPTIKKEKTPMIIESFGKVAHKLMEEEFNQSKYVTKAPNSNEQIKSPKINNFLPRPLNGPMAHKFKRASFLAEAICKEDLSDSLSFQYALKKIAHTHIQKLVRDFTAKKIKYFYKNINRVGSGDFVDTAVVEKMKKFRQKTQDEYFQRSDTAVSRNRKSRPIYNENLTNLTWKTKKEDKNPGFRTTRDIRPWKTTPHFRINTAN